jgi:hypothetical protein
VSATAADVLRLLLDPPAPRDPYRRDVELLYRPKHAAVASSGILDESPRRRLVAATGSPVVSDAAVRAAQYRAVCNLVSATLDAGVAADWTFLHNGTAWTLDGWLYFNSISPQIIGGTSTGTTSQVGTYVGINAGGALEVEIYLGSIGNVVVSATSSGVFSATTWTPFRIKWDHALASANLSLQVGSTVSTHNKTGNAPSASAPHRTLRFGPATFLFFDLRVTRGIRTDAWPPTRRAPAR